MMKRMTLKRLTMLLMVLAMLALCGAAQAATIQRDIITSTDIITDTDIPTPPVQPILPADPVGTTLTVTGPASVRGGDKVTLTARLDGEPIAANLVDWAVYPYNTNLCTITRGVVSTKKVAYTQTVQVTAVLKSNPTVYTDFVLTICPSVSKLSITAPSTYIDLNGSATLQLRASVEPEGALTGVTWSSSSTSRATVDENGLVTAHQTGSVTITAKAADGSGKSAKITLQVVRGVTDLSITGPSAVAEGKSIQLKAVVLPEDASVSDVTWAVDCDKTIATISTSGKLTAKNVEEKVVVTVTATSKQDPSIVATHDVTICPVVSTLTITAPATLIDLDAESPTLQLTAVATPADASSEVTWSSSSTSRATVDENGLVTALKTGSVTITAKATDGSGKSAKITLNIVRAVKGLTITGSTGVASGKSIQLKAVVLPDNATNANVTWEVDCTSNIATISTSGKLTAKSGRTQPIDVTVKAVSKENPAIYATHVVTIRPAVTKVTIVAPQTFIDFSAEDKTLQLSALCTPAEATQSVTWSSSNTKYATVDENGLVTALKSGKVTITAKATDGTGKSASVTINIVKAVKGVVISGATELASGKETKLTAAVMPEDASNQAVTWEVDCASSIATISTSGKLTAKSGITEPVVVTVKATSKENPAVFGTWRVTIRPAVTQVVIYAPTTVIDLNSADKTLQLSASCLPELASQQVTWSSSSTSRATVDANGLVTALKLGTVSITAKANDGTGRSASVSITIVNAAQSLTITGATELTGGNSTKLTATITPDNATNKNVVWSVDCASSIATISTAGRLTAKNVTEPAVVTVTCTSKENPAIFDTHQVTIRPAVGRITISAARTWIDFTSAAPTLRLYATCTPDTAGQGVTWSSSNTSVCTVNAFGLVTGHKIGSATITARANDGSGRSASVTIRVIKPITSITVAGNNIMKAGTTQRLRYSISPSDATSKRLVWSLDCPSTVATISNGVITAKKVTEPTLVMVTAASEDNASVKGRLAVLIMPVE